MAISQLVLKDNATWALGVRYTNGAVRFYLTAKSDRREYGGTNDLALNAKEWDRLLKWVEYQRATEEAQSNPRRR